MVAVIDYGVGNLRSVEKAFNYIGVDACVTSDKKAIRNSSHILLPGVGAFGAGIKELVKSDLHDEVYRAVRVGKPVLGICLGMQLLFEKSYESGEHDGLGLLKGTIRPLPAAMKVPHVGWNMLKTTDCKLFSGLHEPYVYFVHSYYADALPQDVLATCEYSIEFTAAAGRDNVMGVQFHPEKSGEAGLLILKNFGGMK